MSTRKEIAWNGVKGCKSFKDMPVTINEAIEAIGGNYTVKKQPLLRVDDAVVNAIINNVKDFDFS